LSRIHVDQSGAKSIWIQVELSCSNPHSIESWRVHVHPNRADSRLSKLGYAQVDPGPIKNKLCSSWVNLVCTSQVESTLA